MRLLIDLLEDVETVTTSSGEVGHWVMVQGRPVFIREPGYGSDEQLAAKPRVGPGDKIIKIVKDKDGNEVEDEQYSPQWKKKASDHKFARVASLQRNLEKIQAALRSDIEKGTNEDGSMTKEGMTAAVTLIASVTGMRFGQPGQGTSKKGVAAEHFKKTGERKLFRTFGLTTLQKKHAKVSGDTVTFRYLGKSAQKRVVKVTDPDIAKVVRNCLERASRPSASLFVDDKGRQADIKDIGNRVKRFNPAYKGYDFRTAAAMRVASDHVGAVLSKKKQPIPEDPKKAKRLAKKLTKELGESVSSKLGNTPNVAIRDYTSPPLVEHMLRQYGFSSEQMEQEQASLDAMKASMQTIDMDKLELLTIVYGRDAVSEWVDRFLTDGYDAEDKESIFWEGV